MQKHLKNATRASSTGATVGYEAELWRMADALPGSMDGAEYKHVVLGPIFLKDISYASRSTARPEAARAEGADLEDPGEYRAPRSRRSGSTAMSSPARRG